MIAALVINIAEPMRISVTHFKKLGRPEDSARKMNYNKQKKERRRHTKEREKQGGEIKDVGIENEWH